MQLIWLCFDKTFQERKNSVPVGLQEDYDIVLLSASLTQEFIKRDGDIIVIEGKFLTEPLLQVLPKDGHVVIFIENAKLDYNTLFFLKQVYLNGFVFFMNMEDLVFYLHFIKTLYDCKNNGNESDLMSIIDWMNHSKKVSEIVYFLGLRFGLDKATANVISKASLFHDIGKKCMPQSILNKPGWFNFVEKELIKFHVISGSHLLQRLVTCFHDNALHYMSNNLALYHHERNDGSGYMHGKKNLHLYLRIVAVADVYESLRSDRPYRSNCDRDLALSFIKQKEPGFGSDVVSALESLIKDEVLEWL
ncbi:HD-GYP domain-containing protein [Thermodesulfovibrio sp. TK110]